MKNEIRKLYEDLAIMKEKVYMVSLRLEDDPSMLYVYNDMKYTVKKMEEALSTIFDLYDLTEHGEKIIERWDGR